MPEERFKESGTFAFNSAHLSLIIFEQEVSESLRDSNPHDLPQFSRTGLGFKCTRINLDLFSNSKYLLAQTFIFKQNKQENATESQKASVVGLVGEIH